MSQSVQKPKPSIKSKAPVEAADVRQGHPSWTGLRVAELFAGVGGFRLGWESQGWPTVFANQWEPGIKAQHAADIYQRRFGRQGPLFNVDVHDVPAEDIPDHDLLCGGFPCQDYSAAVPNAKGMDGKKGVLWWQIRRILDAKRPEWLVLENVDRLLVSPSKQRGRDFAVLLACLRDLGYAVAWCVVNAAEWGVPQARKRLFIIGSQTHDPQAVMDEAFPDGRDSWDHQDVIEGDIQGITGTWGRRFFTAGAMQKDGSFQMRKAQPKGLGVKKTLADVLVPGPGREIGDMDRWAYVKGAKDEPRTAKNGFQYRFREGALSFPDQLDRPARTILTSEGGHSANRSSHVVKDPETGRLRTLRPVECERIQGFPDGWTEGVPDGWRFKCMGNALAVPLVARIAQAIQQLHGSSSSRDPMTAADVHGIPPAEERGIQCSSTGSLGRQTRQVGLGVQ